MIRKVVMHNQFLANAAELLAEGNTVRIKIDGQSMFPFIRGGKDEVILAPYSPHAPLQRGTCALFLWNGHYMVHRYIGKKDGLFLMMGDGNLAQIEEVPQNAIKGILKTICHPNGSQQDCLEKKWLAKGIWWYRLRKLRRFLIPLLRIMEY